MILPQSRWLEIRQYFTDQQCEEINLAVTGETAMQKGHVIDETKLPAGVRALLDLHLLRTLRAKP